MGIKNQKRIIWSQHIIEVSIFGKPLMLFGLLTICSFIYSQRVVLKTKESGYPALDKLFRLKWECSNEKGQPGFLLIKNGLIFIPGVYEYAMEGSTGKKISFAQTIFKSLRDSLLTVYNSIDNTTYLININSKKNITESSCSMKSLEFENSWFLNDSLYFLPRNRNTHVCVNVKRPNYLLWKFNSESPNEFIYIKYDSSFVFFENEKILLLNRKNGRINWSIETGKLEKERLLKWDNLYFITNGENKVNQVWSLDLKSRKVNWKTEFIDEPNRALVEKNDTLYFITRKALLYIDCKTGKIIKTISGWFGNHDLCCFNNYLMIRDFNLDYFPIYTVLQRKTGEIKYRYFTSEGFPPLTVDDISDEAKEMRKRGESGWSEGVGHNCLDRINIDFTEDKETGLLYGNNNGYIICFELIK